MIDRIILWFKQFGRRRLKRQYTDERRRCAIFIEKPLDKLLLETYLPLKKIPSDSYPVKYNGEFTHFLGLDKKGMYSIDFEEESINNMSPIDLFEARSCQGPVYEIWGFDMSLADKVKLGLLVLIIITIIIISFLMVSQQM